MHGSVYPKEEVLKECSEGKEEGCIPLIVSVQPISL